MPGAPVQVLILLAAPLALPAVGQAVDTRSSTATVAQVAAALTPYTADYKFTMIGSRPDGGTTRRESTHVTAVDAQGRTMKEEITASGTSFSVLDPVAHTLTEWSSLLKQATVHSFGEPNDVARCALTGILTDAIKRQASSQNPRVEDLGTQTIAGIEARGTRTTFTAPHTGADAKATPFVTIMEKWSAVDSALNGLAVREMTEHSPGHSGWTKELTHLTRGDPDRTLFAPPSDYEIVNEKGTCQMKDW